MALLQVTIANAQSTPAKNQQDSNIMIALDYESFNSKVHDLSKNKKSLVYIGNKKAILFYHSKACPSCENLKPIYQQAAKNWPQYAFYSIDTDLYPNLQLFGGNSTPAIVSITMNSNFEAFDGNLSTEELNMYLEIFSIY